MNPCKGVETEIFHFQKILKFKKKIEFRFLVEKNLYSNNYGLVIRLPSTSRGRESSFLFVGVAKISDIINISIPSGFYR